MKRKDNINRGSIRKLSEAEIKEVVGGSESSQISMINLSTANTIANNSMEGLHKGSITPDRKNKEVVPTAGVELATY